MAWHNSAFHLLMGLPLPARRAGNVLCMMIRCWLLTVAPFDYVCLRFDFFSCGSNLPVYAATRIVKFCKLCYKKLLCSH